jgi:hypothetical protein
VAYWGIKEIDGEEWVEWHFVLDRGLLNKLCAVSIQLDVSQTRANFLGSEVRQAVLTHVNDFTPVLLKSHFIKDFVTVIMKPYNTEF